MSETSPSDPSAVPTFESVPQALGHWAEQMPEKVCSCVLHYTYTYNFPLPAVYGLTITHDVYCR